MRRGISMFLVAGLMGCSYMGRSTVEVKNDTAANIEWVNIRVGGSALRRDNIEGGESVAMHFVTKQDSGMIVRYKMKGVDGNSSCKGDVYLTNGISSEIEVHIRTQGCTLYDKSSPLRGARSGWCMRSVG